MVKNESNQNTQFAINAKTFGQRLSLSKRQIFRLNSCANIPAPVRIGGSVRWKISDVELWLEWGCPDRKSFEAMKQARGE